MNILLTGGAGYIGSHVAFALIDKGYNVTIVDNLVTGHKKLLPQKSEFIECDIADSDKITEILSNKQFDALMHFAGLVKVEESMKMPERYIENNTVKSRIFFDTCIKNGLNNFIFSSTASVYGNTSLLPIKENSPISPLNPYAHSKSLTEKNLIELSNDKKINYIILRYFNVAGSDLNLRTGLLGKNSTHLIKVACEVAFKKRSYIEIYGNDYPTRDGTAIRDYIHVSDLSDVHILSLIHLLKSKKSLIMNCGYGKGYSVKNVLDEINLLLNGTVKIKIGKRRKGDAVSLVADNKAIKTVLKWKPKYNNLKDILTSSIAWEKSITNDKIF